MAYKFDDGDKEVREFRESLPFGITEVQITGFISDETDKKKDFIAVGVVAEDGTEDEVRLWFVGGASNISFNNLRQIAVHCADTEEAKEKARQAVDAVADADELVKVLTKTCVGKRVWYSKYYDPTRSYTTENGTFRSVNKNIYGYEPKHKPELMPKAVDSNITDAFPGAEPATGDAASLVPKDDNWAK